MNFSEQNFTFPQNPNNHTGYKAGKEKIMARRKLAKLKALMYELGITQLDIASQIGRGSSYVAKRMNKLASFTLADMCTIGTMLGIPRENLLDYFLDWQ